ncbi:hypothetical protein HOB76_01660, partial [Candidatus Woesearchaeota archaeon]|nr:hypothetical protein [Candidatus Woesearchaeota archaeon]
MSDEDRTYRKNHYPLRLGLGPLEQLLANGVELIPSGYREDHPPDCTFTLFLLNQAPGLTYFISPTSGRLEVQYSPRGAKLQKREYGPGQHAFRFDDDSSFVVSETPDESAHL